MNKREKLEIKRKNYRNKKLTTICQKLKLSKDIGFVLSKYLVDIDIEILYLTLINVPIKITFNYIDSFIKNNYLNLLLYTVNQYSPYRQKNIKHLYSAQSLRLACEKSFDVVKYLYSKCKWDDYCFNIAAKNGNLQIIEFLFQHKKPQGSSIFDDAIASGNLYLVKFMVHNNFPHYVPNVTAVRYGQIEIFKYLLYSISPAKLTMQNLCIHAAKKNQLDMLKYLHSEVDTDKSYNYIAYTSAENNNLEMFKYVNQFNINPPNDLICQYAIINDNLEFLEYAHSNGYPLTSFCFTLCTSEYRKNSSEKNLIDIITYLLKNNCPIPNNRNSETFKQLLPNLTLEKYNNWYNLAIE